MRKFVLLLLAMLCIGHAYALSYEKCLGSRRPYPTPTYFSPLPDSLRVVMINHVGRHGSRYPTSPKQIHLVGKYLERADSAASLTPAGKSLQALYARAIEAIGNRWGELDSVGMAELAGIGARMIEHFPAPFQKDRVHAIASFVPRSVMSMYSCTHALALQREQLQMAALSGPQFDTLMRPFTTCPEYLKYREEEPYKTAYERYLDKIEPTEVAARLLGNRLHLNKKEEREFVQALYYLLSSLPAMGINVDITPYVTTSDWERLWACDNLRQYFTRCANAYSDAPALIAKPLLKELIETTDRYLYEGEGAPVQLRFGHAETLFPLLSLMEIPGCYYMGTDFDSLLEYWATFYITPMGANLQMILCQGPSGAFYLRLELNENVVPLAPGQPLYLPWKQAKAYLSEKLH